MRKLFCMILALLMMLTMAACGGNETNEPEETKIQTNVAEPVTWEKINATFADDSMTEEQLRQLCLDFMRLQLTIGWTPNVEAVFSNGSNEKTFTPGNVYGGIPYVSNTFGNVYTMMQFYDSDNGVLDVTGGQHTLSLFSNQCSSSTFWAWQRVCNSVTYGGTNDCNIVHGCLRVGNYVYDDNLEHFKNKPTADICLENGPEVMFEAYALMEPADGIVNYSTAGHVRMIASEPNIVLDGNGKIDPKKSTVTYLDQKRGWTEMQQSNGMPYEVEGGVDVSVTFMELFNDGYLPFTIAELNKQNPVEKGEVSFDYTGDSITADQLLNTNVTSNYAISNVTVTVKDKDGKEVYTNTTMPYQKKLASFSYSLLAAFDSSSVQACAAKGSCTVEVTARIGTGELLTVYTGSLSG